MGELDAFSFHRPTTYGLFESIFNDSNKNKFPICTYDRKFTEEIIYRSDSRRQWRDGCICKQIKGFKGKSFQLLLHPIWWTKEIKTREENILDLKAIKEEQIERYLEKNLSFYKK